jgi:hypothetical protein
MKEEFLYYIWENRLTDKDLKSTDNEAVDIVATGYRNTDSGPDFLEAKIQIGDKLWAGHVEIHVKTSDWNRHGHQTDKAYQNIVLHVVYENDAKAQRFFPVKKLEDKFVDVNSDGQAFVTLNNREMDMLSSVHCQLAYISEKDDIILMLGSDSNVVADWDKGVFKDNFFGKWPMLNGYPIYVEITAEDDGYNLYAVPIKLNGERCNLVAAYNYKDESYHILGARKGIDSNGMGSRNLIQLKREDRITTIHYAMTISGKDTEPQEVEIDTFNAGDNPRIVDEDMGDGRYGYFFEFVTPTGQSALSNMVSFTINNGNITTSN